MVPYLSREEQIIFDKPRISFAKHEQRNADTGTVSKTSVVVATIHMRHDYAVRHYSADCHHKRYYQHGSPPLST